MCILSDPTIKRTYLLRLNAMICQTTSGQCKSDWEEESTCNYDHHHYH